MLGSDKCYSNIFHTGTVELRLSGRWLTGSAWSLGKFVVNSTAVFLP